MDGAAEWIATDGIDAEYRCVDALEHWQVPEALQFWHSRPADGIRMGRDVPSRAIARLLNRVVVFEPVDDHRDLRVRLAGSALRRRFNCDITGQRMSTLFGPDAFPVRFRATMEAINRNAPRMAQIVHRTKDADVIRGELLTLPVIAPSGADRWALTFYFYS